MFANGTLFLSFIFSDLSCELFQAVIRESFLFFFLSQIYIHTYVD